jgi:hypothetical protein
MTRSRAREQNVSVRFVAAAVCLRRGLAIIAEEKQFLPHLIFHRPY